MPDPFLEAARKAIAGGTEVLRRAVSDLPAEGLNWRPANPEDTNTIAVLTTHAMHSTRVLLTMAAGLPPAQRDRPGEFTAVADGSGSLLGLIDRLAAECEDLLACCEGADWAAPRQRRRDDGSISEMTAGEALLFAVTHLRGHADEAALTRHLWKERT
ncbi:MAG: DinB family protein [Acidimicrobiia bacterium]|nr:DinB family protein [Acidimicrobiia bacterium]